jgi:alanine racemase
MDMIMVNVTNVDCKEGDEAIVFDKNYTAEELAETAGTISYEIITGISQRVKRVYLK